MSMYSMKNADYQYLFDYTFHGKSLPFLEATSIGLLLERSDQKSGTQLWHYTPCVGQSLMVPDLESVICNNGDLEMEASHCKGYERLNFIYENGHWIWGVSNELNEDQLKIILPKTHLISDNNINVYADDGCSSRLIATIPGEANFHTFPWLEKLDDVVEGPGAVKVHRFNHMKFSFEWIGGEEIAHYQNQFLINWKSENQGVIITYNGNYCVEMDTIFFRSSLQNLPSNWNDNQLNVYPNPSKGEVQLLWNNEGNNVTLVITDAKGKILIKENTHKYSYKINPGTLSSGMYFIKLIYSNGNSQSCKLIVTP